MNSSSETIIDLSHLGLLCVSGAGAKPLLQGQLTSALEDITPTQSRLGAHCNPQGRILSLFRLFYYQENYYLLMPLELVTSIQAALQKYAVFFKANLSDASGIFSSFSYYGENATSRLKHFCPILPENTDQITEWNDLICIKLPSIQPHYAFIGKPASIIMLQESLKQHAIIAGENAWRYLNITSGIPTIYSATIGEFLPHDINLPLINGVSFTKGCYTGQEIIARMQYRGQLKKHMYRVRVTSHAAPKPGDSIYKNGQVAGHVVDSCVETSDHYQMLIIANQVDIATNALFIDPDQKYSLQYLELPYAV